MNARRILLLGGSGQLGLELRACVADGVELQAPTHAELDITDGKAVEEFVHASKPAWIINCAAYTAVDRAESEPQQAMRLNHDAAQHLAQAAQRHGARMVQISTDFVFDGCKSSPYLPEDATHPLGVYGQTKLAGEQAVRRASAGDALIIRTAWLYSAHGNNFVKTMLRLLREKPELRVVADQVGTPTSAASLAAAVWQLTARNTPGGVYHYTDAGVASWYDLAVAVRELAAIRLQKDLPPVLPITTRDYPTSAARPAYSVLDKTHTYFQLNRPAPHWREPLTTVIHQLL